MTTHITINGTTVYTNLKAPAIGQRQEPDEVPARDALNAMRSKGMQIVYEHHPLALFAGDVLDGDRWAHATTTEVKQAAAQALKGGAL
jgi:hypothetical protein